MNTVAGNNNQLSRSKELDNQGNLYNNHKNNGQGNNLKSVVNELPNSGASIPFSNDIATSNDQYITHINNLFPEPNFVELDMIKTEKQKDTENQEALKPKPEIRALNFELHDIGEMISSSKQHIIWHFTINSMIHKVELFDSVYTGRRRVKIDNQETYDSGRVGFFGNENFSFNDKLDDVDLDIRESDDCFLLYLNHIIFSQLYLQEKAKQKESNMNNNIENKCNAQQFFEEMMMIEEVEDPVEEYIKNSEVIWCDYFDEEPQSNDNNLDDNGLMKTPFD